MADCPESLVGLSLEWIGVHHSEEGDFEDLSTHTVTYDTETHAHVTVEGKRVGEAEYTFRKLDDQVGVVIYHPDLYRGRPNVVLHAIFDFSQGTDRAVLEHEGRPFAVADGRMREVPTPHAAD
jgi:hypothetical protein